MNAAAITHLTPGESPGANRSPTPDPWIALSLAALKLGENCGALRRKCAEVWMDAGLAKKFSPSESRLAGWYVHVNADPSLRNETDLFVRDAEQIAQLRKDGMRPKYIERGEARRQIVLDFAPFWMARRNQLKDQVVSLYLGDLHADGRVGAKCTLKKISFGQFYAWQAAYEKDGLAALVDHYSDRTKPSLIGKEAWLQFLEFKHQPGDPGLRDCWKLVDALARTKHARDDAWHWPKYSTVRHYYKKMVHPAEAAIAKIAQRDNLDRYMPRIEGRYLPKIARSYEDTPAGSLAIGDERKMDWPCRFPGAQGWRLARPVMTAWIDGRARFFGGWVLEETGNSDTILAAFKMHCITLGTVPDDVTIDNGRDYRAAAGRMQRKRKWAEFNAPRVFGAFERLRIDTTFCKVRHPWAKMIESHFNRVKDRLDRHMHTFCGGSPGERPEDLYNRLRANLYLAKTVEECRNEIARFLDALHEEVVNGDGMFGLAPRQALAQFFTTSPRRVPEETLALMCCRMFGPRRMGKNGLRVNNISYGRWQDEANDLFGQKVYWLEDPTDASVITLCNQHGETFCKAYADNNLGQTRQELRAASSHVSRARRRLKNYARDRDASMLSTIEAVTELRGQAAKLAQIPDDQLIAPPQPETLRLTGAAEQQGVERIAAAVGAEAIRKLKDMNAGAAAVNRTKERRPSIHELRRAEDHADEPVFTATIYDLQKETNDESDQPW